MRKNNIQELQWINHKPTNPQTFPCFSNLNPDRKPLFFFFSICLSLHFFFPFSLLIFQTLQRMPLPIFSCFQISLPLASQLQYVGKYVGNKATFQQHSRHFKPPNLVLAAQPISLQFMELEGEDGSKLIIKEGFKKEIGRGLGFSSKDQTVSRIHIVLELQGSVQEEQRESNPDGEILVYYEVIGKNPIWVFSKSCGEKRVFRKLDKGVLRVGDQFSLSLQKPYFFTLKKGGFEGGNKEEEERVLNAVERRKRRTLERKEEEERQNREIFCDLGFEDLGFESLDVSQMDPVREFGFLVMGQEFNHYPKQKIRDMKDWDWFLEDQRENSKDDEASEEEMPKGRKGERRKNKGEDNDDDDWTGDSEDDKVLVAKFRSAKRPKYSMTRSKDTEKTSKNSQGRKKSMHPKTVRANEDEHDDEDEDEDYLGGFIVNDDDLGEEEEQKINFAEEEEEEVEEEEYDNDEDSDDSGEEEIED
ncbi:SMAD/FHA domain-containing protein [Tasmannia lanceolata]|uniref:SMAD/FHA domain-containing protein n=1 Tax=Tasmannia lanceolata TaxID=3420 RepID=UPI0040636EB8